MSQKITCRCKTENLNETAIQKALSDLRALFPRASFSVENGNITANFGSDYYRKVQVNQAIQERLGFYQKEYLQAQKVKWMKMMNKLGGGKVDELTPGENPAGQRLTKIKISR